MIHRLQRRVAAAVLIITILGVPNVAFGASRQADTPRDVRERIVRIIKKIKFVLAPTDDPQDGGGVIPPKPTGNG
ncbi:MAG: hypothetical protein ACTHQM_17340 [Thermoanaerobaculia bacterium]